MRANAVSGATPARQGSRLRAGTILLLSCVALYTAATLVLPAVRLAVVDTNLRVVIEVVGVCALVFAAAMLWLPAETAMPPARDAFVAALVVMAVANAVFAVGPQLAEARLSVDRGLALYPWVAARHVAGLLFIVAALGRLRLGTGRTVGGALLGLVVVQLVLAAVGDRLAVPAVIAADGRSVVVVAPVVHALLQLGPGLLFAVGGWLAAQLHRASGAVILAWVGLALAVQSAAQLHEILYPAMLGPVVTSADALRVLSFGLLTVGAVAHLRHADGARTRTLREQQRDLRDQAELVDELGAFAEKEELFRSIVSHELATPIATIRAYAQLIDATTPRPRTAALDEAVRSMQSEAERLFELVGRIDELRNLELQGFGCELRPTRVAPLLADCRRFAAGLPQPHPVSVRCQDVRVLADPVRIGQLLRNVVSNAVRFTEPATPIELEGRVVDDVLELVVRDRGPGIPPHERALVLERYGRGGNAVGTDGSGLGLYIARRIAEEHGSDLRLGPGPDGVGTEVGVRLQVVA